MPYFPPKNLWRQDHNLNQYEFVIWRGQVFIGLQFEKVRLMLYGILYATATDLAKFTLHPYTYVRQEDAEKERDRIIDSAPNMTAQIVTIDTTFQDWQ